MYLGEINKSSCCTCLQSKLNLTMESTTMENTTETVVRVKNCTCCSCLCDCHNIIGHCENCVPRNCEHEGPTCPCPCLCTCHDYEPHCELCNNEYCDNA